MNIVEKNYLTYVFDKVLILFAFIIGFDLVLNYVPCDNIYNLVD